MAQPSKNRLKTINIILISSIINLITNFLIWLFPFCKMDSKQLSAPDIVEVRNAPVAARTADLARCRFGLLAVSSLWLAFASKGTWKKQNKMRNEINEMKWNELKLNFNWRFRRTLPPNASHPSSPPAAPRSRPSQVRNPSTECLGSIFHIAGQRRTAEGRDVLQFFRFTPSYLHIFWFKNTLQDLFYLLLYIVLFHFDVLFYTYSSFKRTRLEKALLRRATPWCRRSQEVAAPAARPRCPFLAGRRASRRSAPEVYLKKQNWIE